MVDNDSELFPPRLEALIRLVVADNRLHGLWLNTLSLMENAGARKISASEDIRSVDEGILKHAFEEHRHAYGLKRQIRKVWPAGLPWYARDQLLAPIASYRYLHRLDARVSRYVKDTLGLTGVELKYTAYLLVTYAIEVKADVLYRTYQAVLTECRSPVSVRSILLEEEHHLSDMRRRMAAIIPDSQTHGAWASRVERALCDSWLDKVERQLVGSCGTAESTQSAVCSPSGLHRAKHP